MLGKSLGENSATHLAILLEAASEGTRILTTLEIYFQLKNVGKSAKMMQARPVWDSTTPPSTEAVMTTTAG